MCVVEEIDPVLALEGAQRFQRENRVIARCRRIGGKRYREDPSRFWLWQRRLGDGRCILLLPVPSGALLLCLQEAEKRLYKGAPLRHYESVWEYDDHRAAWSEALWWNGRGEPHGFYRPVGRRRT